MRDVPLTLNSKMVSFHFHLKEKLEKMNHCFIPSQIQALFPWVLITLLNSTSGKETVNKHREVARGGTANYVCPYSHTLSKYKWKWLF